MFCSQQFSEPVYRDMSIYVFQNINAFRCFTNLTFHGRICFFTFSPKQKSPQIFYLGAGRGCGEGGRVGCRGQCLCVNEHLLEEDNRILPKNLVEINLQFYIPAL